MVEEELDFNKSIKNLAAIDYNIDKVIEKYDPKKGLVLKVIYKLRVLACDPWGFLGFEGISIF